MQDKTDSNSAIENPPRSGILRAALSANAMFSAASGILMLLQPNLVASWLGIDALWLLQCIGAGLLLFAADLVHQATRARMASWRALLSSLADFGWVGGTVLLLLGFPSIFSPQGTIISLSVAALVLLFGILQLTGIHRLHRTPDGRLLRHCIVVGVNSSADTMWATIEKIGEISRHMPSLKSSKIRHEAPPGVGCVRECEDRSGKRWAEQCTLLNPQSHRFDVEFLCDEPGFPFPASEMRGGWQVLSESPASCEVMVWWELQTKPRWLAPVILPLLAFQADRDFPRVIRRMAAADSDVGHAQVTSRLIPRFC